MASIVADNIISPLGFTTEDNVRAVRAGTSSLRRFGRTDKLPFGFTASMFSDRQTQALMMDGCTKFESLAINSITAALHNCPNDLTGRTVLVLSSTKGNVEALKPDGNDEDITDMGKAAAKISRAVGLRQEPVVVCNACTSGVSALIVAQRLLLTGKSDNVIVCGVDVQCPFVISGFQSLKALSESECRPFDMERVGLNLGEAAATIILSRETAGEQGWRVVDGAVRNDAYQMVTPSPRGEGAYRALMKILEKVTPEALAVINAHGTATMYNDQMESVAITRAGLSETPVNALKSYFGHTMGAAGIMETILTLHALEQGVVLATRNFDELGVSGRLDICATERATSKTSFIKMISGFGGCNAALLVSRGGNPNATVVPHGFEISHRVTLTPDSLRIDNTETAVDATGDQLLRSLYKERIGDYPRFYKMDPLSKLGFLAAELLLRAEGSSMCEGTSGRGIAFFNRKASLKADLAYLETMRHKDNYFPSPSLFVYTLPNMAVGEIACRHHYLGETAFYVLPEKNLSRISDIVECMFCDSQTQSVMAGWVEYVDQSDFEADIFIANRTS